MSEAKKPCCTPPRGESAPNAAPPQLRRARRVAENAVHIPGGQAIIGTNTPRIPNDGESPMRKTRLDGFLIGATTVTNAEFAAFVADTGYVTEAERFGWSFVFWDQVPDSYGATEGVVGVEWWRRVDRAYWAAPNGPGTEDGCLPNHPVVHVSWADARAYCDWVGGRLPSEAEWEHAARGGLGDVPYPWGDAEPDDQTYTPCNIWQGQFPDVNTCRDGYAATAPAQSFAPNGYGLYNIVGNVWEWTSEPYRIRSLKKQVKDRLRAMTGYKLSKGGSFLCHRSYCTRYRIAARSGTSPDSSTTHHGFRVVWNAD